LGTNVDVSTKAHTRTLQGVPPGPAPPPLLAPPPLETARADKMGRNKMTAQTIPREDMQRTARNVSLAQVSFSTRWPITQWLQRHTSLSAAVQVNSRTHVPQKLTWLNFSIPKSGIDFKRPYSNPP
jgi:hypothetical protein